MNDEPSARTTRTGLAGAAMLLALLAIVLGAISLWSAWRTQRAERASRVQAAQLAARLAAAEHDYDAASAQRQALDRRLDDAEADVRAARDAAQGLDQRTRNLETALGELSSQQSGGRDALLLDDADLLLRGAQQRFELLHDAQGALRAYTLAAQTLAQVQDPAFAPLRAGIANERAALAAAASPERQQAIDALNGLRAQLPSLPLAAPEPGATQGAARGGVLSHLWHAFSGILRIERDESAPLPAADARFARELAALDLAQAQAALLAWDDAGYRAALQRVAATLAAHFDADASDVRNAQASVRKLLAGTPVQSAPQLGGALAQLRDLRATHALQAIAPAPAASSGKPRKP